MIIELKKFGNTLGLRKLGEMLRLEILSNISNNDKIVIDFSGIDIISNSFTDEFIAKLYIELGRDKFWELISLRNYNEDVIKMIQFCIREGLKDNKSKSA